MEKNKIFLMFLYYEHDYKRFVCCPELNINFEINNKELAIEECFDVLNNAIHQWIWGSTKEEISSLLFSLGWYISSNQTLDNKKLNQPSFNTLFNLNNNLPNVIRYKPTLTTRLTAFPELF